MIGGGRRMTKATTVTRGRRDTGGTAVLGTLRGNTMISI